MNFYYNENGGTKLFLQKQSINIVYANVENIIVMTITKRIDIIMGIQVCLTSQMSFDYKENDRKKTFLVNPKHQHRVSQ